MSASALGSQLINLFAAILLLLAFAMLAQRRVVSLVDLFAAQGFVLALSTAVVAYTTSQPHLYQSAVLTLLLKVFVLPWLLYRLVRRLDVLWEFEGLINIPTTIAPMAPPSPNPTGATRPARPVSTVMPVEAARLDRANVALVKTSRYSGALLDTDRHRRCACTSTGATTPS